VGSGDVREGDLAAYVERLLPGWGACLVMACLIAMISIAYGSAFGAGLGWILFVGLAALGGLLAYRTAPVIAVAEEGLRAGGACLPWACLGQVSSLDREAMRSARGPGGDARNFIVLRPWAAAGGVLVEVQDPLDPHPYWLVSTRRPHALIHAISSARMNVASDRFPRTDQAG
jgi:hypothetical protein